jgi:hypothetical protein
MKIEAVDTARMPIANNRVGAIGSPRESFMTRSVLSVET